MLAVKLGGYDPYNNHHIRARLRNRLGEVMVEAMVAEIRRDGDGAPEKEQLNGPGVHPAGFPARHFDAELSFQRVVGGQRPRRACPRVRSGPHPAGDYDRW
ncbi:MAG: hypothetical protein N838_26630 [Thiohalocapsa sp. PB-PSB1]|nr:MAG: hypothetical protein N838_26630 [Thiohalocapsa sp. PB-PSB1]